MTEVKVNGYICRRITRKGEARQNARWMAAFRGELRLFRTRKTRGCDSQVAPAWPPEHQSLKCDA